MQKTDIFRLIGIIALVVVIGLPLTACNSGSSPAPETVATPTATPAGGTYTTAQTVTLSTATARAGIHYTTNGSIPTVSSPRYHSISITISENTTIKAIAVKDGMINSDVMTETYSINLPLETSAKPTATPAGGAVADNTEITLSTITAGASIYYTQDGSNPTNASTLYSSFAKPKITTGKLTLKAIAMKTGMTNSDVLTATYTISTSTTPSGNPFTGTWRGYDPDGDRVEFKIGSSTWTASYPDHLSWGTEKGTYTYSGTTAIFKDEDGFAIGTVTVSGDILSLKQSGFDEVILSRAPPNASSDFTYTETATAVTITGYTGVGGSVTIPATINGKPVTTIGGSAFSSNQLTSITIPNSVTTIGGSAFSANQLTSITIPNSVTTIGGSAFSANQLTSITIPDSVTTIGGSAFYANELTSVTIPDSVISIDTNPFNGNRTLTAINVSAGNPNYSSEGGVLYNKNKTTLVAWPGGIKNVVIPNSVTTIGGSAFSFNQLTSVTIPDSVTTIGGSAFYANELTSITIPNSVTAIGDWAFFSNQLTSVTIPNSVTTIGGSAFSFNQLTSITIPNSVTTIGSFAFSSNQLTSVTIGANVTLGIYVVDVNSGFEAAYTTAGKAAGTYTRLDASTTWTKTN